MMRICSVVLAFVLCVSQAYAAPSCYTPQQFRAEQAIRFHTRLMIIGMRCQRILKAPTAYADYQAFTKRNQNIIRVQENQLVGYYRANKSPSPDRAVHTLRTDIANSLSMQANGPGVVQFCRSYASTLQQAKAMKAPDFQKWILQVSAKTAGASTYPLCVAPQRKR